jgi:pyruvate kinase
MIHANIHFMKTQWVDVFIGRDLDTTLNVLVEVDPADYGIGVEEGIEIVTISFPYTHEDITQYLGKSILEEIQEQVMDKRDFIMERYNDTRNN